MHERSAPRFFDGEPPRTIDGVMHAKLELDHLALEYDTLSPTPLDAWRLRAKDGPLYDDEARRYMDRQLHRITMPELHDPEELSEWVRTEGQGRVSSATAKAAAREIVTQHELKQQRNDQALEALQANTAEIDAETAEEIMQVRAGIASLETYLRFLVRFPEVGGIELMKASRPFDPSGTERARAEFFWRLMQLNGEDAVVGIHREASYYRRIKIEDPRIVVLKTHIANVAIYGLPVSEVIVRDAGVILDPHKDDLSLAYRIANRVDGSKVHVAPIALTGYARLAPR